MKNLETLFVGQNIIHLPDVDSTNNFAANLIKQTKVVNGTAILADNQFSGRGQTGNKWDSEAGKNITVTLIIEPRIPAKEQFLLSKITCLSILDTLKEFGVEAQIKWPNDILVNRKKICGILIENSLSGSNIKNSIIGIGLNLNQTFDEHDKAVSLCNLIGQQTDRMLFLKSLFHQFEKWYLQLEQGNALYIDASYLKSLFALNEKINFKEDQEVFSATVQGVNEYGQLTLKLPNGKIKTYNNQEVKFLLDQDS